jgi:hypothetical protein
MTEGKSTGSPGNEKMVADRIAAQYERWPMTSASDAGKYHQMFMEFGLGFERGWSKAYNQAIEDSIAKAKMGLDHCELVDNRDGQALMNELINQLEGLKKKGQ